MTKTLEELQGEGDNFLNFYVSAEILNNPLQKKLCEEAYSAITENLFKAGQLSGVELAKGRLPERSIVMDNLEDGESLPKKHEGWVNGWNDSVESSITRLTALQGELRK